MRGTAGLFGAGHFPFFRQHSPTNGPTFHGELGIDRRRNRHKVDSFVRIRIDLDIINLKRVFPFVRNSFWSSLLSALLTYHVNWLYSFVTEPAEFFDCGTRVLVLSKDGGLARRLLHILSYFVRVNVPAAKFNEPSFSSTDPPSSKLLLLTGNANVVESTELSAHMGHSKSMSQLACADGSSSLSSTTVAMRRNGSSLERRVSSAHLPNRRSSQQLENTRYLRNYYDVRFQLSPDTIAKRDGKAFANLISSIAKNGFQDFYAEELADKKKPQSASCAFFVGSIPDKSNSGQESPTTGAESNNATSRPVQVQIPR